MINKIKEKKNKHVGLLFNKIEHSLIKNSYNMFSLITILFAYLLKSKGTGLTDVCGFMPTDLVRGAVSLLIVYALIFKGVVEDLGSNSEGYSNTKQMIFWILVFIVVVLGANEVLSVNIGCLIPGDLGGGSSKGKP